MRSTTSGRSWSTSARRGSCAWVFTWLAVMTIPLTAAGIGPRGTAGTHRWGDRLARRTVHRSARIVSATGLHGPGQMPRLAALGPAFRPMGVRARRQVPCVALWRPLSSGGGRCPRGHGVVDDPPATARRLGVRESPPRRCRVQGRGYSATRLRRPGARTRWHPRPTTPGGRERRPSLVITGGQRRPKRAHLQAGVASCSASGWQATLAWSPGGAVSRPWSSRGRSRQRRPRRSTGVDGRSRR